MTNHLISVHAVHYYLNAAGNLFPHGVFVSQLDGSGEDFMRAQY